MIRISSSPPSLPRITPMKLLHVVGARPNFPKLAPVHRAASARNLTQVVVHTGQHYDEALSEGFFRTLGIPRPDFNLEVGSASHALQTARVMERIEPILGSEHPDWQVLYGDVNSTVAAALVAAKLGIKIAHVEAGLRSNDRTMPEEINPIVTDRLANLLLTPSRDADVTLRAEGGARLGDNLCRKRDGRHPAPFPGSGTKASTRPRIVVPPRRARRCDTASSIQRGRNIAALPHHGCFAQDRRAASRDFPCPSSHREKVVGRRNPDWSSTPDSSCRVSRNDLDDRCSTLSDY